ncbi:MAG: DUF4351 domain-containing protein [Steroidobacteraceae bacterium]
MPSQLHEALILLFRNRPTLAPELVCEALRAELPQYSEARVESADLTDVQPAEYRADLVVLLLRQKPVFDIVVEVQLGRDEDKPYVWPAYAANLRVRIRCPVCLLVMTPQEAVARWAAKPIELGGQNRWVPWVVGPSGVPQISDEARASEAPELAVLSAMAHGRDPDPLKAARIAHGAHLASLGLDADRGRLYFDLVSNSLSEAARRALQAMDPAKYEYQSEFARRYIRLGREEGKAEGMAEGMAEGKAEGRAEILIKLLGLRFGALPPGAEARIRGAGIEELDRLAVRVLTAQTLEDALGAQ